MSAGVWIEDSAEQQPRPRPRYRRDQIDDFSIYRYPLTIFPALPDSWPAQEATGERNRYPIIRRRDTTHYDRIKPEFEDVPAAETGVLLDSSQIKHPLPRRIPRPTVHDVLIEWTVQEDQLPWDSPPHLGPPRPRYHRDPPAVVESVSLLPSALPGPAEGAGLWQESVDARPRLPRRRHHAADALPPYSVLLDFPLWQEAIDADARHVLRVNYPRVVPCDVPEAVRLDVHLWDAGDDPGPPRPSSEHYPTRPPEDLAAFVYITRAQDEEAVRELAAIVDTGVKSHRPVIRSRRDAQGFILDVSFVFDASILPAVSPPAMPRRRLPVPRRETQPNLGWLGQACGVIIVNGPYYVVATDAWTAGAEAGDVLGGTD